MDRPSDEEILAGCRALYPALFRDGLEPQKVDGPQTVSKMREVRDRVRRILEAANEARKTTANPNKS
jgi:hypothetical protein